MALTGRSMLVSLREAPDASSLPLPLPVGEGPGERMAIHGRAAKPLPNPLPKGEGTVGAAKAPAAEILILTLGNPALWLLGVSLGLLNACRYGFLDWGVTHLMETKALQV